MDPFIRGLLRPEAYDHPVGEFRVLETHISWVILTGTYAYKLKKPVDFGFVNFTTLPRRQHFCEEEIRLNQRLAPELYLGIRPVFGPRESATFVGQAAPIDFAVQMRQFDQEQLLPAVLARDELTHDQIDVLAEAVAQFHRNAAVAGAETPFGTPEAVKEPALANLGVLDRRVEHCDAVRALRAWTEAEFLRRHDWFQQRRRDRRIRECHGDMHLGNMVLLDGVVRVFDCLEFNPQLRWTDVIAEVAFLVMDLAERGRPDLAARCLNGWLEQTGDFDALTGWRWYIVYRALVRAKVAALRLEQGDLTDEDRQAKADELANYLQLATSWTGPRATPVFVMHGVSGTGKSRLARMLCEAFGGVQLRSDVERKRLFGQWGEPVPQPLTGDLYAASVTRQVYDRLAAFVPLLVNAGFPVVIDATCLLRWQRDLFRQAAQQLGVPFVVLDLQASPETLRGRIVQRQASGRDPSDADVAVLELQLATREPLGDDEQTGTVTIDTEDPRFEVGLVPGLRATLRK